MNGRERVSAVLEGKTPDHLPYYGWLFNDGFAPKLEERYGSADAFEDEFDFSLKHLFPPVPVLAENYDFSGGFLEDGLPSVEFTDPNSMAPYEQVKRDVALYGEKKGRFTYAQSPGAFEFFNGVFGIENHLAYLLLYPDELKVLYQRLADWTIEYAGHLLKLGVDMIHVSDDWGSQKSPLFSPEVFRELIFPSHKRVADAVHRMGGYVSLHSDGNIDPLLDGVVEIGYDVVHPYQVSSGMDYSKFREKYRGHFSIMGGIDVQTTIGFGDYDRLEREIREMTAFAKQGGMILCTSHMIQPHCSVEEAEFAYRLIRSLA